MITTTTDPEHKTGESLDRWGPTAVISYLNIAVFTLTAIGVFVLIWLQIEIESVWAGILGAILGSTGGGLATTNQFWLGGNIGTKATTRALTALATTPSGSISAPTATTQNVNVLPVAPPADGAPPNPDLDIPPEPGIYR